MFSLPIVQWPRLTLGPTLHPKRSISSIMSSGVNRPEREFNNSHLSINEVNNECVCTFAFALMAWTGTNFTISLCLKIQRIKRKISEPVCGNLCFIFTVLNTKNLKTELAECGTFSSKFYRKTLFLVCVFHQSVIS
jgi:hypothetical protein